MKRHLYLLVLAALLLAPAAPAAQAAPAPQAPGWPALGLQFITGGLQGPVEVTHANDGSGRLFVVEQRGEIQIVQDNVRADTPFLDIRGKVSCCGEQGLLGLAFAPDYATSGFFYVHYTNTGGNTVVARYRRSGNPALADPASETVVLTVIQPFSNHNGGKIAFGADGYLYLGLGDGGSGGDPQNHGQRLDSLLGKLLRLDVQGAGCVTAPPRTPVNYCIPPDNPFVSAAGARPEIWALGLRNPWKFSFDRQTHDLYTADVGQGVWEEVDFQAASAGGGQNYGWNIREGNACYNATVCANPPNYAPPVAVYDHGGGRCSVTGGYVFRGTLFRQLRGIYFYADFCSGQIYGLRRAGSAWESAMLLDTDFAITTFGENEYGALYVVNYRTGNLYRITGAVEYSELPYRTLLPQVRR